MQTALLQLLRQPLVVLGVVAKAWEDDHTAGRGSRCTRSCGRTRAVSLQAVIAARLPACRAAASVDVGSVSDRLSCERRTCAGVAVKGDHCYHRCSRALTTMLGAVGR